ncbi:MAG: porin family protein, partial [Gammaproteobacteria bacterium]|nr:porin family protein [Gammaproteobacteria bacterium]
MKNKLVKTILFIVMFSGNSFAYAEKKNSFSFKSGSFALNKTSQTIDFSTYIFEEESTDVFSFEYERQLPNNYSIAVGMTRYSNEILSGSAINTSAEVTHVMILGRKYLGLSKYFLPYLGVGIGPSIATIDGSGISIASLHGVAGLKIPLDRISLLLEYKVISSTVKDINSDNFEVSGDGVFAGISFNF